MKTLFPLFFVLLIGPLFSIAQTSPCSSPEHRQFDFWVGEWEVYSTEGDTLVGRNHVKNILNSCVIEENWTGKSGFQGKSFNTYNRIDSTWNQVWVDQNGATYHFSGRYADKVMALKGQTKTPKGIGLFTLDFTYNEDMDTVRQVWKMSRDNGVKWEVLFDGTYRRKGR